MSFAQSLARAARTRCTVFRGTVAHSASFRELRVLEGAYLGVDNASGRVAFLEQRREDVPSWVWEEEGAAGVVELGGRFIVPGFVDTHTHAPQYCNSATGRIPLLDWLETFTFPTEARFSDAAFARDVYTRAVRRHLLNGTTTCAYYATIHTDASLVLRDIMREAGQRGFVGKVCMDQNSPDYYVERTEESLEETRRFVDAMLPGADGACEDVRPIVTPRFAPTCSSALMRGLAEVADRHGLPVQSHLSENHAEIAWVAELFPGCDSYTDVYARHGLLHERAVMAHCVHLTEQEKAQFKERNAGVSHCPNSNFTIHSGTLDVRDLVARGIKVGLGTDVSGGCSPSMLDAMRQAILAARSLDFDRVRRGGTAARKPGKDGAEEDPFDLAEAFYLATVGGARVLNMEDRVGTLDAGMDFDALVVDPAAPGGPIDVFEKDSALDRLNKFVFIGDDRNIAHVFVRGRDVTPARA